jgi:hypothetical protein
LDLSLNREEESPADSRCLFNEHNLVLALDLRQSDFDLAPYLLPVLVLLVAVVHLALHIVAIAVCVVKHDIAVALKHVLVAEGHLARASAMHWFIAASTSGQESPGAVQKSAS